MSDYRINKLFYNNEKYKIADRPNFGNGFGVCNTESTSQIKAVTISNFSVTNGCILNILFNYDVYSTAESPATLNVNSIGAKSIYYRNAIIGSGLILAGDLVTFIYDGTLYHIIGIDRKELAWQTDMYKPMDVITFNTITVGTIVTNSRTRLQWLLQVDKPIDPSVVGYRVTDLSTFRVWGNNATICSYDNLSSIPGYFSYVNNMVSEAGIQFYLVKNSSGTWTSDNNNYTYILQISSLEVLLLDNIPSS